MTSDPRNTPTANNPLPSLAREIALEFLTFGDDVFDTARRYAPSDPALAELFAVAALAEIEELVERIR